jgi:hypothetical protein
MHDLAKSVDAAAGPQHPALGGSAVTVLAFPREGEACVSMRSAHCDPTVYALRSVRRGESGGAVASAMA